MTHSVIAIWRCVWIVVELINVKWIRWGYVWHWRKLSEKKKSKRGWDDLKSTERSGGNRLYDNFGSWQGDVITAPVYLADAWKSIHYSFFPRGFFAFSPPKVAASSIFLALLISAVLWWFCKMSLASKSSLNFGWRFSETVCNSVNCGWGFSWRNCYLSKWLVEGKIVLSRFKKSKLIFKGIFGYLMGESGWRCRFREAIAGETFLCGWMRLYA